MILELAIYILHEDRITRKNMNRLEIDHLWSIKMTSIDVEVWPRKIISRM